MSYNVHTNKKVTNYYIISVLDNLQDLVLVQFTKLKTIDSIDKINLFFEIFFSIRESQRYPVKVDGVNSW